MKIRSGKKLPNSEIFGKFLFSVKCAFTLVELVTLIAVLGVLATLLISAIHNVRVGSQQATCVRTLKDTVQGIELYTADLGKRPRSLSRVVRHLPRERNWNQFICPSDPAFDRTITTNHLFWGNLASASQEPWADQSDLRDPESGSWTAELAEVEETEPFSYLHPLSWRRAAWLRLMATGSETGMAVCQLHGVRVPINAVVPYFKRYLEYEGQTFRALRDGAVTKRRVFRPGALGEGPPGSEYPWEFYSDVILSPIR